MAAFIATRYAEKYPNRLASLVYASPAGVPHVPEDYNFNPPRLTQSITGRMALWTARHLWTNGTTPQGVVRSLGRWVGKGYVIDGYVKRRFPDSVPNKDEFAEYMYQHWQGESSGEQILNALLRFGAHAKEPLCHRIPHLDESIPVTFIYGTTDWMDSNAGKEVKAAIEAKAAHQPRTCELFVLPDCGHQLYIENPNDFNDIIIMNCQPRKQKP
jgi:pimeloyl-ACP methyl ester carboxylesterase